MRAGRLLAALGCVCGLLSIYVVAAAVARPGDLDRSFAGTGSVAIGPQLAGTEVVSLAVGPGNASFVLEKRIVCLPAKRCSAELFPARYRRDGSRDAGFSQRAQLAAVGTDRPFSGGSVAVDSGGRAVIASIDGNGLKVVRLLPDGSRDPSFGQAGEVVLPCGCEIIGRKAIAFDGNGRIVIEARAENVAYLARLLVNGQLDAGFGASGMVMVDGGEGAAGSWALRPSGSVVLAGIARGERSRWGLRLVRVGRGGGVDWGFGREAEVEFSGLGLRARERPDSVVRLLARRNRGIDLLGNRANGRGFAVRLRPEGRLGGGFGEDGVALRPWSIEDAALDPLGRIVAIGHRWSDFRKVVFRLRADGRRDRGFGVGSAVGLELGEESWAAIAVGRNRRPVVLDSGLNICRQSCPPTPTLLRLLGGPRPDRR